MHASLRYGDVSRISKVGINWRLSRPGSECVSLQSVRVCFSKIRRRPLSRFRSRTISVYILVGLLFFFFFQMWFWAVLRTRCQMQIIRRSEHNVTMVINSPISARWRVFETLVEESQFLILNQEKNEQNLKQQIFSKKHNLGVRWDESTYALFLGRFLMFETLFLLFSSLGFLCQNCQNGVDHHFGTPIYCSHSQSDIPQ